MSPFPEGMAAAPAVLREADVFALATAGMLEAARDYVLLGRVHRARRRGPRLAAEVEGTDATYACAAEVHRTDDAGAPRIVPTCECPSRRPHCKHILALLLLWATDPAVFAPVDTWEADLRTHAPAELAALLADAAMGADPLELLRGAATALDWAALPPGRCLEEWDRFRAGAEMVGRWPEAALELGVRIAGPPGAAWRPAAGAEDALAVRQLAWWLTRMIPVLPPPALLPWLEHLFARLRDLEHGQGLPPELGVWLGRLAAALPEARAPERRWLARFAAHTPTLAPVFEAELQRTRWEAELTLRMAVAPAVPARDAALPAPLGSGCREALAVFETERGALAGGPARSP